MSIEYASGSIVFASDTLSLIIAVLASWRQGDPPWTITYLHL